MKDTVVRRLVLSDALLYRALMLEAYTLMPEAFTSSIAGREALPLSSWPLDYLQNQMRLS